MQWIVGHGLELHFVVIYIEYWSTIDSLQWDVESSSRLDFKEANTLMGPSGPRSELVYHDDTVYEGWIGSRLIFMRKSILVIT